MKIALICKSDSTGGAAIVSRRLTEALREEGHDARLLVLEKLTDLPYVVKADYPLLKPLAFLCERLQVFLHNGFSRRNLFKVDTGAFGLPLWCHPVVRDADAVILNWVNQGMLSLKGVKKIASSGKKTLWVMHDMWNMTGICHHSHHCRNFEKQCGECYLLGSRKPGDLSRKTWERKRKLYAAAPVQFVAVSRWLAGEAAKSKLMKDLPVAVIPNPFRSGNLQVSTNTGGNLHDSTKTSCGSLETSAPKRILFAAATLDNYIKGLDTFRDAVNLLAARGDFEVVLMGAVKNPDSLNGFKPPVTYLGSVVGDDKLAEVYSGVDILVNSSSFENLPGTLVEAQAYGAVPVSFDRGGQSDIIDHLSTGYLAAWSEDPAVRARNLADGIEWAMTPREDISLRMKKSVEEKFSYASVAKKFLDLLS